MDARGGDTWSGPRRERRRSRRRRRRIRRRPAESGEDASVRPPVKRQRRATDRSDMRRPIYRGAARGRASCERGTPRVGMSDTKRALRADEGTGERPGGESHGTRRHYTRARCDRWTLAADNCHAQNGYSPLAAWHGGLETARASAPLAPDVDGEDTRATPVRSRRRARRAPPAPPPHATSPPDHLRPALSAFRNFRAPSGARKAIPRAAAQMARRAPVSRDLFVNR